MPNYHCHHYDQVENLQRSIEDCVPRGTLEEANRQYNEITAKYVTLFIIIVAITITNIIISLTYRIQPISLDVFVIFCCRYRDLLQKQESQSITSRTVEELELQVMMMIKKNIIMMIKMIFVTLIVRMMFDYMIAQLLVMIL